MTLARSGPILLIIIFVKLIISLSVSMTMSLNLQLINKMSFRATVVCMRL